MVERNQQNTKMKKIGNLESLNNNNNNYNNKDQLKKTNDASSMDNTITDQLLIFANEKEDLINKWIAVLNYFINK